MKWTEVAQSCLTLCYPMGCSLPGSSVHGIFQARILEWVAISFSRVSSQPRKRTPIFWVTCIGRQVPLNPVRFWKYFWALRTSNNFLSYIKLITAASSKYSVYIGVNEKANSGMHCSKVEIAWASEEQKPSLNTDSLTLILDELLDWVPLLLSVIWRW